MSKLFISKQPGLSCDIIYCAWTSSNIFENRAVLMKYIKSRNINRSKAKTRNINININAIRIITITRNVT